MPGEADEIVRSGTRGEGPTRLPGTRREVEEIAALFPASQVTSLLGEKATEGAIQAMAQSGSLKFYRYLHFATHGKTDPNVAMSSALLLAPERERFDNSGDLKADGRITAEQIVQTWDLDAELVVLSACETALGKYAAGEGYLGFAQALFVKGARSLVLSQWEVNDRATSLLMRRFYENLLGRREGLSRPMPKAEALHEAKAWLRCLTAEQAETALKTLKFDSSSTRTSRGERQVTPAAESSRPYEHPYYWAGFILIGNPD